MGIKGIHLVLITLSIVLMGLLAWWANNQGQVLVVIGAVAAAVVLLIYMINFIKKLKHV